MHEPKRLLPEAVGGFSPAEDRAAEDSVKVLALSVNSRVVAVVRAG
jgi:hypothetical protein